MWKSKGRYTENSRERQVLGIRSGEAGQGERGGMHRWCWRTSISRKMTIRFEHNR